jgi:hypothetical protein
MPKANEPETIPLDSEHEYNNRDLSPKEFLLAIMRDQRIPLPARMEAAAKVAVYEHPRLAQTSQDITGGVKIVIEGGLPALPGTDIIMPTVGAAKKVNGS